MKIKKSKHVHHDRGYTPVVNCKLTSRRISHYATSTSYQKLVPEARTRSSTTM